MLVIENRKTLQRVRISFVNENGMHPKEERENCRKVRKNEHEREDEPCTKFIIVNDHKHLDIPPIQAQNVTPPYI